MDPTPRLPGISPSPTPDDYHQQICHKLEALGEHTLLSQVVECGARWTVRRCRGCLDTRKFSNHCDLTWCPRCQPRIARERRQSIEFWAKMVKQPKHVVLTCRNTKIITSSQVRKLKDALTRLRRSKFARNWAGGCWSFEVTNESRGWHLHLHLLVDSPWIDAAELARTWGRLVGQEFAIVKVKDARDRGYLGEVCKYAVKGSEMAKWSGHEIVQFILALDGFRTFGVFGSLYKSRAAWQEWKDNRPDHKPTCECGCDKFEYFDEPSWEWNRLVGEHGPPTIPPPPPQLELDWDP